MGIIGGLNQLGLKVWKLGWNIGVGGGILPLL